VRLWARPCPHTNYVRELKTSVPVSPGSIRSESPLTDVARPPLTLPSERQRMRLPKPWLRGRMRASSGRSLPFPAGPHLRTALLGDLEHFDAAATYPEIRWRYLSSFAPQVLAGTTEDLENFADGVFQGAWEAPTLDTAVFNLTTIGYDPLTAAQRDKLWRVFRVPVYEVLFDCDAGVLASECEAHEGWHVRHQQLRFDMHTSAVLYRKNGTFSSPLVTGLTADGLDGICACGDDALLLRGVRTAESKPLKMKAAGA
jgi:hypothetical protein